jgi:hypothetical protein
MERENLHGDAKGKGTSSSNCEAESTDAPAMGALPRSKRPDTLVQDRKAARSTKPLATHGRTIHWVKGCPCDHVGSTSGVPQIAADLSRRSTRQPWATTGLMHRSKRRA